MSEKNQPKRLINLGLTWEDFNWPSIDMQDKIKRRAEAAAISSLSIPIPHTEQFPTE